MGSNVYTKGYPMDKKWAEGVNMTLDALRKDFNTLSMKLTRVDMECDPNVPRLENRIKKIEQTIHLNNAINLEFLLFKSDKNYKKLEKRIEVIEHLLESDRTKEVV